MKINHKYLFNIKILHDYFADYQCKGLLFVPTSDCLELVKNYGIILKQHYNQLIAGISSKANKPKIEISKNDFFRFYIKINKPYFINITNMEFNQNEIFYFSNLNENSSVNELHISEKLKEYSISSHYTVGSIIKSGTEVFESIQSSTGKPLNDKNFWFKRTNSNYVDPNQKIQLVKKSLKVDLIEPSNDINVTIYGFDKKFNTFTKIIKIYKYTYSNPVNDVLIEMAGLPTGRYYVECNGKMIEIYYDKSIPDSVIGIIEIYNCLPASSEFALFNNLGEINNRKFLVRFANRLAIWKYRNRKNRVNGIIDGEGNYTFQKIPNGVDYDYFISDRLIPLTEKPNETFTAQSVSLGDLQPIMNPDPNRLNTIEKEGNIYYCSEINLTY